MPAQEMHRYMPAEPPIYHEPTPAGAYVQGAARRPVAGWASARPAPETTFTDDLNATMKDLGDAFRYVSQSVADVVEIVTSAPIMAAEGLDKGVKGLPLPGHAAASGHGTDPRPVPPPNYREWSRSRAPAAAAPAARGGSGKPRLAEMATAAAVARPPSGSSGRTPSGRTPRTPRGGTLAAASPAVVASAEAPSPIPGRPDSADRMPSRRTAAVTPSDSEPSQKLAAGSGTLGLPRAGFSASLPSPATDSASPGTKPRLSGYYGADKTGGMSVA